MDADEDTHGVKETSTLWSEQVETCDTIFIQYSQYSPTSISPPLIAMKGNQNDTDPWIRGSYYLIAHRRVKKVEMEISNGHVEATRNHTAGPFPATQTPLSPPGRKGFDNELVT
jgi:hypothetical protein